MNNANNNDSEFEEVYSRLWETIESYCNSDMDEPEDIQDPLPDKAHELASWYGNTQSLMKLLYELESEGKLSEKQKRTYHRKRKEFGWKKIKNKEDISFDNLAKYSPFTQLSLLFEHDCMVYRKEKKAIKAIDEQFEKMEKERARELFDKYGKFSIELRDMAIYDLAHTMQMIRDIEADGGSRTFIDENSGVSALYNESEAVEAQAIKDIKDIKALSERLDNLLLILDSDVALKKRKYAIEHEIIYKAIELGYSAGLNANTTEALRRNRANNSSDNRKTGENNSN